MTSSTLRCFLLSLFLIPLTLSAQSAQSHRPATAPPAHHAVAHVSHCVVPPPALSPKIPAIPATLGCPKLEYALTYLDTKVGTGELVQPRKLLTVAYTGYLTDGTKFDSSYDHPDHKPITFPYGLHQVIPGWDTGFEGMHVGGKRRLFIPYELAYGETGRPPVIPPKSELIFDVELISQADLPQGPPGGFRPTMPGQRPGQPSNPGANPNGGTPPPAGTPPTGQPQPQSAPPTPPPTSQPQTHSATPQPQPQTTPPPAGNPPGSTQPQPQQ
ncbi:MAG TPA: FKBP-type peptidyl-prolyl cis-trans isomerase [Acidobacteriaceae bacterium]|nr:FKBP-type peptidyl-prolyl cis-trans isomerase [Acidobacteriaceae bacterium]